MKISTQLTDAAFNASFEIRLLRKHDPEEMAAVVDIVNRCYRTADNWTNESALVRGMRIHLESLEASLRTFEILVVVQRADENVVACVKTGVTYETMGKRMAEPAGYLGLFGVLPEYQSKGVGSRLMQAAENFCASKGVARMCLDVLDVRHDIIEWYHRRGYRRVGGSVNAAPLIEEGGETLLVPCSFILLQKSLKSESEPTVSPTKTLFTADECTNELGTDMQDTGADFDEPDEV